MSLVGQYLGKTEADKEEVVTAATNMVKVNTEIIKHILNRAKAQDRPLTPEETKRVRNCEKSTAESKEMAEKALGRI